MRLYVGNLPFTVTKDELRLHFAQFGRVTSVMVSTEKDTGRPRGFGFVEFADDSDGRSAIKGTNGLVFGGRPLKVKEADPKEARDGRFGGRGGYWSR